MLKMIFYRGGSTNSLAGVGVGVPGRNSSGGGGGGGRLQVRGNFHMLTSKKKQPLRGGVKPPNPPPPLGSATVLNDTIVGRIVLCSAIDIDTVAVGLCLSRTSGNMAYTFGSRGNVP